MKPRRIPCLLCALTLVLLAAAATAQQGAEPHDALARARERADLQNQHVLLLLTGGEADAALIRELGAYRRLGKLLRYEYQLAALPADSLAGKALRSRLGLEDLEPPVLAVLDTEDRVLGALGGADGSATERVRAFLQEHVRAPQDARAVLREALATAKRTARHAFVYLSAPW